MCSKFQYAERNILLSLPMFHFLKRARGKFRLYTKLQIIAVYKQEGKMEFGWNGHEIFPRSSESLTSTVLMVKIIIRVTLIVGFPPTLTSIPLRFPLLIP